MPSLRYRDSSGVSREVVLGEAQLLIGRVRECDIRSSDGTVTRKHAVVLPEAGAYWIRDLGSDNGTWVNGVRVVSHALQPGDRIQCGGLELSYVA